MNNEDKSVTEMLSEFSEEKTLREEKAKQAYLGEVVKNATFIKADKTTAYRSSFEVLDRAGKINKLKENKISEFQKLLLALSMSTYSEKKFADFQKKICPDEEPLSRREFYRQLCIKNRTYEGEEIDSRFVSMVYENSAELIKSIETDQLPTIADYLAAVQKERMHADPMLITQRMTRDEWRERGLFVSKQAVPSGETEQGDPLFDAVWAVPKTKGKKFIKDFVEFPLMTSRKTRYTLFNPSKGECDCPNFEGIIKRLEDAFHLKINVIYPDTQLNDKVYKGLRSSLKKNRECFWFPKTRKYAPQLCVYSLRLNKAGYLDTKAVDDENALLPLNKNEIAALTVYELAKGIFAADFKGIKKNVKKTFNLNTPFWKRHGKHDYYGQFMTINEASCLLATQMVMRALPLDDKNVVASRKLDQGLGFAFASKMAQFNDLKAQWVLPVIKETAMEMAFKFYKEMNISPAQLKENCARLGYTVPSEAKSDMSKVSRDDYTEILFAARDYNRLMFKDEVYNWLGDEEETLDSLLRESMATFGKMPELGVERVVTNPEVIDGKDDDVETLTEEVVTTEEKVDEKPVGSEDFDKFIFAKLKKDLKQVLEDEKIGKDDARAQSYYRIFETVQEKTALKGLIVRIIGKEDYEAEYARYLEDIEKVNLLRETPKTGKTPHERKRDEVLARIAERDRRLAEEKSPIICIPYNPPLLLPAPQEKLTITGDKVLRSGSKYVEDIVEIAELRGKIENKILDLSILKICKETIDSLKKSGKEPDISTVAEVIVKSINVDNLDPDFDSTAVTFTALKKLVYTTERDELNAYAYTLADGISRLNIEEVIASLEKEIDSLKNERISLMTGINQTIVDEGLVVEGKLVTVLNREFSYDCTCKQWFKDGKVFDKDKCNSILTEVDEKIVDETRKTVKSIKIEFNKSTKTIEEQFEAAKKKIFAEIQKKINVAVSEIGLQANKKLLNATRNTRVNELTALKDLAFAIYVRGTTADKKIPANVLNPTYSTDGKPVKNYTAIVESYKEQAIQDVNGVATKLFDEIIADMQQHPENYRKVDASGQVKLLTPTTIINKYFGGVAARKEGIRALVSDSITRYAVSLANIKDVADDMKISVDELSKNMSKSESYTEVIAKKLSVDKTVVETKVKLIQKDDGELEK